MSDGKEVPEEEAAQPLAGLLDRLLYAPIGALGALNGGDVSEIAAKGRARVELQLRNARFIGEMAVQQGGKELARRLRELARATQPSPSTATSAPPEDEPSAQTPPTPPTSAAASPPIDHVIAGYDDLAASQVLKLLEGASDEDLEEIIRYEATTRGRRTILNRATQLRGQAD